MSEKIQHPYKLRSRVRELYGLTAEEYLQMVEDQGNRCAICGTPPGQRSLHIDHDHETGKVRALLCHKCNIGLGHFQDNTYLLRKAADYLEAHNG